MALSRCEYVEDRSGRNDGARMIAALSAEERPDTPTLNLRRLRFADGTIETRFQNHQFDTNLRIIRLALLMSMMIWSAFGVVDAFATSEPGWLWFLRFGFVLPVMVAVFALSYTKLFRRGGQRLIATMVFITGVGVVGMEVALAAPWSWRYYPGLIAVLTFSAAMFRLHPSTMIPAAVGVFALHEAWMLWVGMPLSYFVIQFAFLLMGVVVAGCASYSMELYIRQRFARDIGIERALAREEDMRQRAQAADKTKSEFLAVMSHELRTPLNAIIGFAEVLRDTTRSSAADERAHAQSIYENGTHLLGLLTNIMNMSRAEAGELKTTDDAFELDEAIRAALKLHRDDAEAKEIELRTPALSGIVVQGDPRLFRQVLINLVGNAVKFTETGMISVTVDTSGDDGVCVAVSDTGPGIPPAHRDVIFEPFRRVADSKISATDGAGIGLALAQRIVWLHDGEIRLESSEAGSTFTIELPETRIVERM